MGKQFINVLLCGAMVLSTATYYSCSNDDVDDLKSRITVIEGLIGDMQAKLEKAITTGATITSATESNGVWTLRLSSGETITIRPTSGGSGGGSDVTLVKNEKSVTITINGTAYVLPLGSFINSLVYSPEYVDGIVNVGDEGLFTVNFLATPTPTAEDLANATFKIETHELLTRASFDLFEVVEATLDNGFVKATIQALEDVKAGATYAGALVVELDGAAAISSNYFSMAISSGFSFGGEELATPSFAAAVTDAKDLATGFWAATLPEPTVDFLGTFNFKDLFASLPAGNITFALGKADDQNDAVKERYDFFKSCLSADGTWEMKGRPGTNCAGTEDKPGILILVKADNVTKAKIYWQIVDPIAAVDWDTPNGTIGGSPHYEFNNWGTSTGKFDIMNGMVNGYDLLHSEGFPDRWQSYEVGEGGDVLYVESGKLKMGELGEKMARHSRGIFTLNIQTSLVNGSKEMADGTTNGSDHEVMNGKDGIPVSEMAENGVSITQDGFINFEEGVYAGQGFRVGPGLRYEYAYGERTVGSGVIAFMWFNRRNP